MNCPVVECVLFLCVLWHETTRLLKTGVQLSNHWSLLSSTKLFVDVLGQHVINTHPFLHPLETTAGNNVLAAMLLTGVVAFKTAPYSKVTSRHADRNTFLTSQESLFWPSDSDLREMKGLGCDISITMFFIEGFELFQIIYNPMCLYVVVFLYNKCLLFEWVLLWLFLRNTKWMSFYFVLQSCAGDVLFSWHHIPLSEIR